MRCSACGTEGHRKDSRICPARVPAEGETDELVLAAWRDAFNGGRFVSQRQLAADCGLPWSTFCSATERIFAAGKLQTVGHPALLVKAMTAGDQTVTKEHVDSEGNVHTTTTTKHGMPVAAARLAHDIIEATKPERATVQPVEQLRGRIRASLTFDPYTPDITDTEEIV